MNQTILGKILEKYREKYNLSQRALCRKICSDATYFNFELGVQELDFVVMEALLARLGQDVADFEFMLDDDAYDVWAERLAIRSAMAGKQYDILQKLVEAYRMEYAGQHKLHEQFCLYYEMKLAQWRGEAVVFICELAHKALSLIRNYKNEAKEHGELINFFDLLIRHVLSDMYGIF